MLDNNFFNFNLYAVKDGDDTQASVFSEGAFSGVLLYHKPEKQLTSSEKTEIWSFIGKIFKAVSLDLEKEVLSFDLSTQPAVPLSILLDKMDIRHVFLLGVNYFDIGVQLSIAPYATTKWKGITFLQADAPDRLMEDVALKRKLWKHLKPIFDQ